ncbi:MAG: hypothetical protein QNJ91_01720 [Gammaproteobacteria bacterium]|nr:hypothetical protein [Gammaproteobacteria bacterium]
MNIWGETPFGLSHTAMNSFYNGLAGHSSVIVNGQLDTIDLSGVNLLWATQPGDSYTAAELAAMASYLSVGGRIAFMGEHGTIAPQQNNRINAALTFLGANIQIQNVIHDSGFRSASVGDGQILMHPLLTGVNTYEYAAYAPLNVSGAAETLMIGEDQPSVMMAFQNIGPGSIFLITDQNVWDNAPNWGGTFDNGVLFENLITGETGAPPVNPPTPGVPVPAPLALLALGMLGLAYRVRQARH